MREHEEEAARRVTLYLDNALPQGELCPDELAKDGLERAISLAASLAADYLERGYAVRVVTRGDAVPPWLQGTPQLVRLLRTLALLPTVEPEVTFPALGDFYGGGEPILVVRKGGPRASFQRVIEA